MRQRLSLRESRRLQRRFLQNDDRTGPVMLLAGSASSSGPGREPVPVPQVPARGQYEWQYPVSDGYAAPRTIIVP